MLLDQVQGMRQFVRRQGLDHMIAFTVCALLVFFAIGAKVAMYHPTEPGARSIASAKVWMVKQPLADSGVGMIPLAPQSAVAVVLLLSLCILSVPLPPRCEQARPSSKTESLTPLAVRPPPAI